jgi:hypothetical protein|tara:strand:+ start:13543 stop:13965 length:423 start_codon:yes stop_codon:yes gene_type:complete
VVENLGLAALSRGDQMPVQALQDVFADLGQLGLNLLAVLLDEADLGLVALGLLLLLDRGDDSPRCTAGTDYILIRDGEEVSLFNGELLVCGSNGLHVLDHFCSDQSVVPQLVIGAPTLIALGLFGQLGQVYRVFVTHFEV